MRSLRRDLPISMVVLSIFKLYGSSLILGFLTSLIITAVLFVVRVYVRLKGKTLAEKNLKESVLVGAIISATFLMYTVIYSAITSSNFVPFAFAFITYILWRYYKNLEGTVSIKRVLKMCIFVSIFNISLGSIYALRGLNSSLILWFSCWIGLIVALIIFGKHALTAYQQSSPHSPNCSRNRRNIP